MDDVATKWNAGLNSRPARPRQPSLIGSPPTKRTRLNPTLGATGIEGQMDIETELRALRAAVEQLMGAVKDRGALPMALTYSEAAFELSVSETTLRLMVRSGELRVAKVRGRWRVPLDEVRRVCTPTSRGRLEAVPPITASTRARQAKEGAARGRVALRQAR
jgi:excisionase family DNA binding protein